jgi:hypothetical protein
MDGLCQLSQSRRLDRVLSLFEVHDLRTWQLRTGERVAYTCGLCRSCGWVRGRQRGDSSVSWHVHLLKSCTLCCSINSKRRGEMPTPGQHPPLARRIRDFLALVGCAVLVCALAGGAFLLADLYHVNPVWVILSLISVAVLAGAREEYRKEFRSVRFVAFVCGWVVINAAVFIFVLGLLS